MIKHTEIISINWWENADIFSKSGKHFKKRLIAVEYSNGREESQLHLGQAIAANVISILKVKNY